MSQTRTRDWAWLLLGALFAWALVAGGCDSEQKVRNSAPRLTYIDVRPPAADTGYAEVTLWVEDLEGDSVDVVATVVEGAAEPLAMVMGPGGHGLNGLTTREARLEDEGVGQPHLVVWDTAGVTGTSVRIEFIPTDHHNNQGPTVNTPSFALAQGLEVTALEASN